MTAIDLTVPQRQSPLAAIFIVIKGVRAIGIVQIVVGIGFVFSQSGSITLIAIGALVVGLVLLVIALLTWWRYTFSVDGGELRVESGVLSRNRLVVPLDRVQSVSIEQKFLHRIVGLVEVSADTAGTAGTEFSLSAVNRSVAEAVQAVAADHRHATQQAAAQAQKAVGSELGAEAGDVELTLPPPAESERVVIARTPMELVKVAFTTFPIYGLAIIGPLLAVSVELSDYIPFGLDEISVEPGRWLIWFVPLLVVAVIIFGALINTLSLLLREWNLTITQTAAGLRRNAGLLSKRSTASSIPRIQMIRHTQNVLERWAKISSIRLVGASQAINLDAGGSGGSIAVDGCTDAEVAELRRIVFDGSAGVDALDQIVSPTEIYKQTRNTTVVVGLLVLGLVWSPIGRWAFLFLAIIPVTWWVVRRSTLLRRWGMSADAIADRQQLFGHRSAETLLRKTNSVSVRQNFFERRRDLATVVVELANGNVTIGMIPIEQAMSIRDRAIFVAETDDKAFM